MVRLALFHRSLTQRSLEDTTKHPFPAQVLKAICDAADLRESPVGVLLLGATPKTLYADAVTGVSKACVVETTFPGQFTKKEFDADRPFATLNAKLQDCGADPIKWDVIL